MVSLHFIEKASENLACVQRVVIQDTCGPGLSSLSEYFGSNLALSHSQIAQLQEILKAPKLDLFNLDSTITVLTTTLDSLKKQKNDLDRVIFEHHQLLAPFRRCPDDILREIFTFCLPVDHNALMDITEAPLLLGRVCSRWRELAYTTPCLWNTLHVCTFSPPMGDTVTFWIPPEKQKELLVDFENLFRLHYAAVQEWIGRSGILPLSISINLRRSEIPEWRTDLILPYLDILLSCSHRWKSLEMCIPSKACSTILHSMQSLSYPQLDYIHLVFPNTDKLPWDMWNNSKIFNGNRLQSIRLSRFPFSPTTLNIDWSRFTKIVLYPSPTVSGICKVSLKDAFEILKHCQRLQQCGLAIGDNRSVSAPIGVLHLPSLESLILIDEAFQLESLVQCFDVPSLTDISYFTPYPPTTPRRSPLVSLLALTNGRVKSLNTALQFLTVQDLLECFTLLPSLTSLTNSRSSWANIAVRQRRWEQGVRIPYARRVMKSILFLLLPNSTNLTPGWLCPKLRTLHLSYSKSLTEQDALDFIQQRLYASAVAADGVSRLEKVKITLSTPQTIDIVACLQPFIDEGLNVIIKYPTPLKDLVPDYELIPPSLANFSPQQSLVTKGPMQRVDPLPIRRSLLN